MTGVSTSDHLHGWKAIGAHLGIGMEAARHLARTAGLPTFKIGKTVAGSRARIEAWRTGLADQEAAAREVRRKPGGPEA